MLEVVRPETEAGQLILVVEDVEETRDGIEALLKHSGYQVACARDESHAAEKILTQPPNLILISLGVATADKIAIATRLAPLTQPNEVSVVILEDEAIAEGAETEVSAGIYLARPDNFDQLRRLFRRLLA